MQFPITIGLHRSRFLDAALLLAAFSATAAALAFRQSPLVQLAFVMATWLLFGLAWRQMSPKLSAIRLERAGQVSIRGIRESDFLATRLLPGATVHPWLTIIRLVADNGQCHTLIATVDSLNRQDFRRLRVFLRWQADFNVPDDDA
ncbi:protein YgfX [Azonexus sp. IMCC34842]|uniref:protein YgfX n=1 Tax=Azonexus sp. IMCC34842 TaxID=3420950 RepID=UPI003D0C3819